MCPISSKHRQSLHRNPKSRNRKNHTHERRAVRAKYDGLERRQTNGLANPEGKGLALLCAGLAVFAVLQPDGLSRLLRRCASCSGTHGLYRVPLSLLPMAREIVMADQRIDFSRN